MNKVKKSTLIRLAVCVGIIAIAIPIAYATGVFQGSLFKNVKINGQAIVKLIVMVAGVLAVEATATFILGLLEPKNHRIRSIISIVSSLLKYIAVIVILCWGLTIIGVNVSTIVASVGIVALIVGFSAESLIADVVTGAFMIFENQYNVGDIVEVDGFRGTVISIGIRTTCIADPGDNVKIVDGPLTGFTGIVDEIDLVANQVKITISMFGRETPVELELDQVEPEA